MAAGFWNKVKGFFGKVGNGIKKGFQWIKDKAIPAVGKVIKGVAPVAQTVAGALSAVPGQVGAISKIAAPAIGAVNGLFNG